MALRLSNGQTAVASVAVAVENSRKGYYLDAIECKFIYLRRAHPADDVELCLGTGNGDCTIIKLRPEQVAELARDAVSLHFTRHVKA